MTSDTAVLSGVTESARFPLRGPFGTSAGILEGGRAHDHTERRRRL